MLKANTIPRPMAQTFHLMKILGRLALDQLWPMVKPLLDPLQFTYQPQLGAEDAIIHLQNHVYAHLDKPESTVRVMIFFGFFQQLLIFEEAEVFQHLPDNAEDV